ncbi:DUF305 domain-containing protein [Roseibium salinum]|uniref:DUF305 domain-containing protein n=1 Tax=Roseibium salinum TaxID=1604349 RepID=A0ABT3QX03_9HYPH|nr:DUF305 domain-containing protein [Roseibium sp. DSM 29163]MCX2721373.1 DUF305 domain-containing protein [Roseibium sp. DSM 29163]MDN3722250.1 DUF305 domain-containing protein [Roseibium salinum]
MSYIRFGLMILTSTVVMFVLMYLNTYAWEHVFFSETRVYMAILMGATMAVIMLAYMLGMYSNKALNIAIFIGAIIVFALSLWLVRSQSTVSGPSYMRAMIPHHSIAVMTSERSQIRDPRVRKLADEIIRAQRQEIAEMRFLISQVSSGKVVESIYEDPPAEPGSIADALSNTLISELDLSPMPEAEAERILEADSRCTFNRSPETDPVLWAAQDGGRAAMKLNGVLVGLDTSGDPQSGTAEFSAPGTSVTVRSLGEDADWRADSELVFQLDEGLTAGYRGFYNCGK